MPAMSKKAPTSTPVAARKKAASAASTAAARPVPHVPPLAEPTPLL
ncbi:MAG: hypothetical protein RJA44_2399, partial [Pseudomonadota bacterium]